MKRFLPFAVTTSLLLSSAAGSGGAQDGAKKAWNPAAGTAGIRGTVKFNGTPPKRRPVDMGSEPKCCEMHPDAPRDESVIVNPNGTLSNVFVWVKKGLDGWSFPVPETPALLDQKGCTYLPHVLGMQVGQKLMVRNSDALAHNIHALPESNREFNFSQAQQGLESEVTFNSQEVAIKLKCDIHGWMNAYIAVVKNPFFTVTGEDGSFTLGKLPPGEYTIEAWQEKYGKKTATVKIGDNETKDIEFLYEGK